MIKIENLIKNIKIENLPKDHLANLERLVKKLNIIETSYGKSLIITSGYRTKEDQIQVYAKKGITDLSKIPMGSKHISGEAVDLYDPKGEFNIWCKNNESVLIEIGIWLEVRQGNWQHIQIAPFKSYKSGSTIWFNP